MCHIIGRELIASHAAPYARHCRCTGFHQDRLRATVLERPLPNLQVKFVEASTEADLAAVSTLRVQSFYVYPKERAFAGMAPWPIAGRKICLLASAAFGVHEHVCCC
jgi:hypothetical protein